MLKIHTLLALLSISSLSLQGANTASNDSVPATQLQEVVVKGENQWITNGKAVFLPTRQSKRLAKDMESMIQIMNTPMLTVKNGKITTSAGEPVAIYINGFPADGLDKSTFWANNVLSVEFYPTTDDPRFHSQRNVVNFIMKEYVAGGVTRIEGDQTFPNDGDYKVSSKLVVKKMTYNVMARGGYSRNHSDHSEAYESFDNIWYNNTFHDLVTREDAHSSVSRRNYFKTEANARYQTSNFRAIHGIAFDWNQNPNSGDMGSVTYSPEILPQGRLNSLSASRESSVRLNGRYARFWNNKIGLQGDWLTGYSHNNNRSSIAESGADPIYNSARENAWMLRLQLQLSARISSKFAAAFSVNNSFDQYNTGYSGSTTSEQKLSVNQTTLMLNGYYTFSDLVQLGLAPQVAIFRRDVNESFKQTDWLPGVMGMLSIKPQSKSFLQLGVGYLASSPGSSIGNDLILRQTELKWIEGNPGIKPEDQFDINLDFSWMPLSWMSMNVYVRDIVESNQYYISYTPGGEAHDGIIGKFINGLRQNSLTSIISFSFKPTRSLDIYARMEHGYTTMKGIKPVHQFRPQAHISWYFSDFSLYAGCSGPEHILVNGGTGRLKTQWQYDFRLNYGNGHLMCSLEANNIFNKYRLTKTTINNGPYYSQQFEWNRGQNVSVSVTYYFDYGKKVSPSIEIQGLETGDSSILTSK